MGFPRSTLFNDSAMRPTSGASSLGECFLERLSGPVGELGFVVEVGPSAWLAWGGSSGAVAHFERRSPLESDACCFTAGAWGLALGMDGDFAKGLERSLTGKLIGSCRGSALAHFEARSPDMASEQWWWHEAKAAPLVTGQLLVPCMQCIHIHPHLELRNGKCSLWLAKVFSSNVAA